jgi:hypothetical protein
VNTGHAERVAAGVSFDWQALPPLLESLEDVPASVEALHLRRVKHSHRGLSRLTSLKTLWARGVNQAFLEEISSLIRLETLYVDGLTATDLTPLANNGALRRLILVGGTKVSDLTWARGLPADLRVLFLERFGRCPDLSPLTALRKLESLGFEGGMDGKVRVETLAPLAQLGGLRFLFLAGARVEDRSLAPLAGLAHLERLECGGYFPDLEFTELRRALPRLECDWFELIEKYGGIRAGMDARFPRRKG